jgi:hypothetical protein
MDPTTLKAFIAETAAKMKGWSERYDKIKLHVPYNERIGKLWVAEDYGDETTVRVVGSDYEFSHHSVSLYEDDCRGNKLLISQEELDTNESFLASLEEEARPLVEAADKAEEERRKRQQKQYDEDREKKEKETYLRLKEKYEKA